MPPSSSFPHPDTVTLRAVRAVLPDDETLADLRRLTRTAARVCHADSAAVILLDRTSYRVVSHHGVPENMPVAGPVEDTLTAMVLAHGSAMALDLRTCQVPMGKRFVAEGFTMYAGAPLPLSDGGLAGALAVHRRAPVPVPPDELEALDDLARLTAVTLESGAYRALEKVVGIQRGLLDSFVDGFYTVDRDFRVTYLNAEACRRFGLPRESILGRSLWAIVPHLAAGKLRDQLEGALSRGLAAAIEHVGTDGRWFSVRAYPTENGLAVHLHEVTEARRASEAIHAANEQLSTLVETAPVAIYVVSQDLTVKTWNRAAEQIFGWRAEEVLGAPLPLAEEERPALRAEIARVLAGERLDGLEVTRLRRDGTKVELLLTSAPLREADGSSGAVLMMAIDNTVRKRAIEQLLTAQKLDAIGRLAGGVAHDFNNLLGVIRGYADLLAEDLGPDDARAADVEQIRDAADRGAALTRQLLTFSRKQVLEPKVLDLNATVSTMFQLLRRIIGEDIELSLSLSPDVGCVRIDPSQMEQALLNLAANARDAMPNGGTLHISTTRALAPPTSAPDDAAPRAPSVCLAVTDNGRGMDEVTQRRLFEPFFTTKGLAAGSGLGLATVYGVIEQSGGQIEVESEVGRGTTFRLYLPIVEGASPAAAPDLPLSTPRAAEGNILLVEDEPYLRAVAARVLRSKGYHVLEAPNGKDALELLGNWDGPIAALITDLIMPGMNGREVADRALLRHPTMRVLFISGYTEDILEKHGALDPGMAFVGKPFTPRMLLAKLRELLDSPR